MLNQVAFIMLMVSSALSWQVKSMDLPNDASQVQGPMVARFSVPNIPLRQIVSVLQNRLATNNDLPQEITIQTIHGTMIVNDPLVIELIMSPAMQRLKKIRQYGTIDYLLKHRLIYNRFDHSLGVYFILRKHGASHIEQIAGLLHDVSHTVFSHSTDPLFMGDLTKGAYQDTIHDTFLAHYGLKLILEKYGIFIDEVMPKNKKFRALGQEAPALNADRIEYNIYAAHMDNLLSPEAVQRIHDRLHFDGDNWYFDDVQTARDFALIPLHQTIYMWGGPSTILVDNWTCSALRRALAIGLINNEDISFNMSDDELWEKLKTSSDSEIISLVRKILHGNLLFSFNSEKENNSTVIKAKFRGVDPLIKTCEGLFLLSELDPEFKRDYEAIRNHMQKGWHIVLHDETTDAKDQSDPRLNFKTIAPLQEKNSAHYS
jgi:HD superfamily phosphohydrolase